MARSINTIQQAIIADLVTKAAAAGVTITPSEWSAFDYRQLLSYVVAVAIATLEQLWDAYRAVIEAIVSKASPQTGAWFQAQMLKFQFDATTPQILQFDDSDGINSTFAPYYETVDTDKQVIKYCAVVPGIYGSTVIKVAADVAGAPADIEATYPGSLDAAQSYALLQSVEGIVITVQSGNSDKIYIAATVYYQGGYAAVIESTVIAAIKNYLATIPFNGVVLLSGIGDAIQAVPGVTDLVFTNVQARADGTAYGSGTDLVIGVDGALPTGNVVQRRWATVAGYAVPETTATHELTDSLTFIPG